MKVAFPVEAVSDTSFLTAYCRAVETERPDALFHDHNARMLAGKRGEQILQRLPGPEMTVSGCSVRTCLMDSLILQAIKEDGVDTVINLGAGLDTRPFRLPLAPTLYWIEVDDPQVLAYKASQLDGQQPACALECVPLDVSNDNARRALLQSLGAAAEQALVLTEGLLVYLSREQVASLACDLCATPSVRWWLSDLISADGLQLMQQTLIESPQRHSVRLLFAPEEGPEFFRQYGWEIARYRSCLDEGQRLDRWFLSKGLMSAKLSSAHWSVLRKLYAVVMLKAEKQL